MKKYRGTRKDTCREPYLRESLPPETLELMGLEIKRVFDPRRMTLNPHKVAQL